MTANFRIDGLARRLQHTISNHVQNAYENLDRLEAITRNIAPTSLRQDDGSRATNTPSQPLANVISHDWIYTRRSELSKLIDYLETAIRDVDELATIINRLEPHRPDDDTTTDSAAHAEHKCNAGTGKKLEGWSDWHIVCFNIVGPNEIIDGMCIYCLMRMNKWRTDEGLDPITRESLDRHYRHPHRARNGRFASIEQP